MNLRIAHRVAVNPLFRRLDFCECNTTNCNLQNYWKQLDKNWPFHTSVHVSIREATRRLISLTLLCFSRNADTPEGNWRPIMQCEATAFTKTWHESFVCRKPVLCLSFWFSFRLSREGNRVTSLDRETFSHLTLHKAKTSKTFSFERSDTWTLAICWWDTLLMWFSLKINQRFRRRGERNPSRKSTTWRKPHFSGKNHLHCKVQIFTNKTKTKKTK